MVANRTRFTPARPAFEQGFTVTRQTPGAWNPATGLYDAGSPTNTDMQGSVQPADGDAVLELAENERRNESISVWVINTIAIKPVRFGDADQTQGDLILYDGVTYRVRKVWNWNAHGHQQVLAVRIEGQDG